MSKLTKQDWIEEGFQVLREFAQQKLRALYLCKRLGVSRGSFYHHFENIEAYITALLKEWELKQTLDLIDSSKTETTPSERLESPDKQVLNNDQLIEVAIRSWSIYNPLVKQHLDRVDEIRIRYTADLLEAMGQEKTLALQLAKLEYATLIGIQMLFPKISPKELNSLYEAYKQNKH